MVRYDIPVEPDLKVRDLYDEAYSCYREAGEALAPVSHRLAARGELEQ